MLSTGFLAGEHLQLFSLWLGQRCPTVAGSSLGATCSWCTTGTAQFSDGSKTSSAFLSGEEAAESRARYNILWVVACAAWTRLLALVDTQLKVGVFVGLSSCVKQIHACGYFLTLLLAPLQYWRFSNTLQTSTFLWRGESLQSPAANSLSNIEASSDVWTKAVKSNCKVVLELRVLLV